MSSDIESVQPEGWPRGRGYAHGMSGRGRIICVAGQVGWDPVSHELHGDMAAQTRQAFVNILAVLRAAGAEPAHLVRLTWYVTDRQAYTDAQLEIGAAYRECFGTYFPAMSVIVVAGLLEPAALVEIEATAIIPD